MSESFSEFMKTNPLLAAVIVVFMVLPIVGAIVHIILKALGRRGIDNSPPSHEIGNIPEEDDLSNKE